MNSKLNKILEIKFGSHLYGTSTPQSDLDLKAIYLPTAKEIILHNYQGTVNIVRSKADGERNTSDDVDVEILSLDRFLTLLLQGQTMALDILFAPTKSYTHITYQGMKIMDELQTHKYELLNKNVNAFVGYARQQAAKYGQKGFRLHAIRASLEFFKQLSPGMKLSVFETEIRNWMKELNNEHVKIVDLPDRNGTMVPYIDICDKKTPIHASVKVAVQSLQYRFDEYGARALQAERNEGVDWKALSHAVRVNCEAQELLETGRITFPRPERELLLKIKTGQMPYKEVANIIEDGLVQLGVSQSKSSLRTEPNRDWANEFLYRVYSEIVRGR